MKKFSITGIILIDCWGDWWLEQQPDFMKFYLQLEKFITERINYQYIVSSNTNYADNLKKLPNTHIVCQEWKDLELHLGAVTGNWLIGGQTWGICTHDSNIGLKQLLTKKYTNFLMFSHPTLFSLENPNESTSNRIFVEDTQVKWTDQWTPLKTEFWAIENFLR